MKNGKNILGRKTQKKALARTWFGRKTKGKNGRTYDSSFEARFADYLLDLKRRGVIKRYYPSVKLPASRKICDFLVTLNNGKRVFIELDGLGPARLVDLKDKIIEYRRLEKENGIPVIWAQSKKDFQDFLDGTYIAPQLVKKIYRCLNCGHIIRVDHVLNKEGKTIQAHYWCKNCNRLSNRILHELK